MANLGTRSVGRLSRLTDKNKASSLPVMRCLGKLETGHSKADSSNYGCKEAICWF